MNILALTIRLLCGLSAKAVYVPDESVSHIYFANHTSHLDALAIWSVLPEKCRRKTRPVAAADYWGRDPLRRFVAVGLLRSILVERIRPGAHNNPLRSITDAMANDDSIIIFPEGTRSVDGRVGCFKPGLYHLAKNRPQSLLVPVFVENLNRILPKGEFLPIPLVGRVIFGDACRLAESEKKEHFLCRMKGAVEALKEGGQN